MLKDLWAHKTRVLAVFVLVLLLACVRGFEDVLFYDPLLDYYRSDFTSRPWPEIDTFRLSIGLLFRYSLNAGLSLGIIYAIFKNAGLVRFTTVLYGIFFVILIAAFFVALALADDDKMLLFYIRRFIIQPIFVLLFIPAFYFQQRNQKNNVY